VAFTLRQQPFFYQTRWFAAVMAGAGLLLVFGAYRWRVRQMAREMSARFDERLAERTRVARELHDTFLQTVQGSKMVADHALKNADDHARMVRAMEQLATWMDQATKEGRAALNSLRGSTAAKNDLAEAFRRAIDECRPRCGAELSFAVHGQARELHPVARDEVYRIGYEAVRNACMHSGAGLIALELRYAQDLVLLVKDNGVGMEPSLAERGKEGHFGVQGMRERAARIGARLTLVTGPGTGTEIALTVPGRIIFSKADPIENHR
jgi:signal transduction histidine kinase